MIQKQIALLVISTLISILGISQRAPGYLGNRLSLGVNFQTSPALFNPNKNGNSGFLKFNTQFGATIEYATNRHASILAHYQTYYTKKEYDFDIYSFATIQTLYADLNVSSFGFEYRTYSGSLAPQGFYMGAGLSYKKIRLTQPLFYSNAALPLIIDNGPYSLLSLGFSMGKQRIYFNRLIISTGVNLMIPLEFGKLELLESSSSSDAYTESADIYKRIALHDLINFKISARFLLF